MSSRVIELLRSMELFGELADSELGRVARLLKELKASENEIIFEQGDTGDALYIVLSGRVRIARHCPQKNWKPSLSCCVSGVWRKPKCCAARVIPATRCSL